MSATIDVRQIESIPEDATAQDFNKLSDPIKSGIVNASAAGETSATISDDDRKSIESIDVVRFTTYYCVKRSKALPCN